MTSTDPGSAHPTVAPDVGDVLAAVGPRLRQLRNERGATLAALSEQTGISASTLSRLEAGQRRANLELLLPIARAHGVTIDALLAGPTVPDPRVTEPALRRGDRVFQPLTRRPGGLQAYKITVRADATRPDLREHDGYEWLFVLSGRARVVVAHHDLVLTPGEAAEFDTRLPHWIGSTGDGTVELLSLFGPQGERVHLRAGDG